MKKERSLMRKIYFEKSIEKIASKITLLGNHYSYDAIHFLNWQFITCFLVFLLSLFLTKRGYIVAPLLTFLTYFAYEYILLDRKIKFRQKKLEEEAIFFFEVLSLSLESGQNLNTALSLTSKNIESELAQEFQKSLKEIQLGKSFNECLTDMKKRIPSETINNTILNMTESNIFGSSILESLNNQLEYLKEKRLLEIKGEINKLPTKISVISVIFFLPILLLIILAPVLLEYLFG